MIAGTDHAVGGNHPDVFAHRPVGGRNRDAHRHALWHPTGACGVSGPALALGLGTIPLLFAINIAVHGVHLVGEAKGGP